MNVDYFLNKSYLQATRGARNPNLNVLLRMRNMYIARFSQICVDFH